MNHNSQHISSTGEPNARIGMQFLAISLLTFVACGATCIPKRTIPDFQPQPVFTTAPTLDQLVEVLNRTRNVQSLQSSSVSVSLNDTSPINANMTWAREKKFRMTASVMGVAGVDIGSNEQSFWWTMRNFGSTPEIYFARHDEFESSVDRRMIPVSPIWLIEAMGVSALNPGQLQNPVTRADGLVEMTSTVPSPIGNYSRTLIVDPKFGYSKQVLLTDPSGRFIANAQQSKHQYYPSIQTSLPHHVKVQLIPAYDPPVEVDITIGAYLVNGLSTDNVSQFTMPNTSSYRAFNLTQINQGAPQAITPPLVAPPQSTTPRTTYRGVQWDGPLAR